MANKKRKRKRKKRMKLQDWSEVIFTNSRVRLSTPLVDDNLLVKISALTTSVSRLINIITKVLSVTFVTI